MIWHVSEDTRCVRRASLADSKCAMKTIVEITTAIVPNYVQEWQSHANLNAHKCCVENSSTQVLKVQAFCFQDHPIRTFPCLKGFHRRGPVSYTHLRAHETG